MPIARAKEVALKRFTFTNAFCNLDKYIIENIDCLIDYR